MAQGDSSYYAYRNLIDKIKDANKNNLLVALKKSEDLQKKITNSERARWIVNRCDR